MRDLFQSLALLENGLMVTYGITLNEAMVMCSVGDEAVLAGTIAERTGMTPSHVSKVICRVEKKGLMVRKVCENDRRSVCFTLTEEGRSRLKTIDNRGLDIPPLLTSFFAD